MSESPASTPGQDYRVELEAYAGPLDLLLYLVKRHEIDLNDIPIAKLTDQYMRHLALIQSIDIERAGEFLVMASALLEIKSAMLSLHHRHDEEEEGDPTEDLEETDPRYELVQQLLAYKRYKDAANELSDRHEQWADRAPVRAAEPDAEPEEGPPAVELELEDVSVLDLCEAFSRILESVGQKRGDHEVVYDDTPIALHAEDIEDRLRRDGGMTLQSIFVGRENRSEMIGLFLATLELVRQRRVVVAQEEKTGEILLQIRDQPEEEEPEQDADWRNPETGEVDYDWPSEEERERYERRQERRGWEDEDEDGDEEEAEDEGEGEVAGDSDADAGPDEDPESAGA